MSNIKRPTTTTLAALLLAFTAAADGQEYVAMRWPDGRAYEVIDPCDACGQSVEVCDCRIRGSFATDLLYLGRNRVDRQSLVGEPFGAPLPNEVLNAGDLHVDLKAGVRSRLTLEYPTGIGLELAYFGVFDQLASEVLSTPDMFFQFYGRQPGAATDAYTVNYSSDLHSGEVNWHFADFWRIRPLVGFRWVRLDEQFDIIDTANTSEDAFSEFSNEMLGGQFGANICLWDRGGWFRVEATLKGVLLHNDMSLHAEVRDAGGVVTANLDRAFDKTAFAGELGVTAVLRMSQCLAFRFGYHGFWLSGVGLAADQSDNISIATGLGPLDRGDVQYQGGFAGLELAW